MPEESLLTRTLKLGSKGKDVDGAARAMHRYLNVGSLKAHAAKPPSIRRYFGPGKAALTVRARRKAGFATWKPWVDQAFWAFLVKAGAPDALAIDLMNEYRDALPPTPKLGPVFAGGKSVLEHDLTHATDGIPLYPAFDDAFREGTAIIAPEPLTVTQRSSSKPGEAFYATGASRIRYWFGHLDRTHAPGTKFGKGAVVGRVAPNSIGGGPHVHVGINVEYLLGAGRQLAHRTDYRHGAPLIGDQLGHVSRNQ